MGMGSLCKGSVFQSIPVKDLITDSSGKRKQDQGEKETEDQK